MRTAILFSAFALATAACMAEPTTGPLDTGKSDGENGCLSDEQLIGAARSALMAEDPARYTAEGWTNEGRTEQTADLDGDGGFDLLVFPGIQYASTNEEIVVMHSGGDDCIDKTMRGHFIAASLSVEDSETPNTHDLRATSFDGCATVFTWYVFDGERYAEVSEETDTSGCDL